MSTCSPEKKHISRNGFSIIELLIAMVIISFLGTVIYATFSQGMKLWQRAVEMEADLDSEIIFEKIQADLRNSYSVSGDSFKGSRQGMVFYGYSRYEGAGQNILMKRPAKIEYSFDPESKRVLRSEKGLREMLSPLNKDQKPLFKTIGENIKDCRFEYYYSGDDESGIRWKRFWRQGDCLPEAVRISLQYDDDNKIGRQTRILPLPAGGCR